MPRSAQAIDDSLRWYAHNAAAFAQYVALEPSFEGRPIGALRLRFGGGAVRRPAVLLLAGLHGNELMLPDLLMDFVEQLFFTRAAWVITQGRDPRPIKTWPPSVLDHIRQTLDIVVLPLANPDGRELVLSNQADAFNIGRKNRRPTEAPWVGVDLNRNFPLPTNHGLQQTGALSPAQPAPSHPSHETYRGASPLSEAESRNIQRVLTLHAFECMIDLHMNAEKVLYSWGHAAMQHASPVRHDFMPLDDLAKLTSIGNATARAMNDVRSDTHSSAVGFLDTPAYRAGTVYDEYGKAPGSALDYARDSTLDGPQVIYGFCLELGRAGTPLAAVDPADIRDTFTPQGFTGMLTILDACAQGVFRAPGRVRNVVDTRRVVGIYESIVKDTARNDRPPFRLEPGPGP